MSITPGSFDNSFSYDGRTTLDYSGRLDRFADVASGDDGTIVAVGVSTSVETVAGTGLQTKLPLLARYKSNGELDETFGLGGKVVLAPGDLDPQSMHAEFTSVAVGSSGKIVAAGFIANNVDRTYRAMLMRFDQNGLFDPTFNGNGIWYANDTQQFGRFFDVALTWDGKIVAAGNAGNNCLVARFNINGALDNTFDGDGRMSLNPGSSSTVNSIALGEDGKVTLAGKASDHPDQNDLLVARVRADGTLDTSFSGDGWTRLGESGVGEAGNKVVVQPNTNIVVGGYASGWKTTVWRFYATGALDSSFGDFGVAQGNYGGLSDMVVQNTGKIVSLDENMRIRRFHADGSFDYSMHNVFGSNAKGGGLAEVIGQDKVVAVGSEWISRGVLDAAVMVVHAGSIPNTPINVKATAIGKFSISVSWFDKSANESHFEVQRSNTADFASYIDPRFTPMYYPTSSVNFTDLPANSGWYFRVRAVNDTGKSPWSAVVYTKVLPSAEAEMPFNTGLMNGAFSTIVKDSRLALGGDQPVFDDLVANGGVF